MDNPHVIRSERRVRRRNHSTISANLSDNVGQDLNSPAEDESAVKFPSGRARIRKVKPQYYLGYYSATALNINRMIGTGIFVGPAVVLSITESKSMSMILWLVGGIIAWSGMSMYLEYGIRWPLTGGELHYIDRVWTRGKRLLTYLYSIMFMILSGSHANALVFGSAVYKASTPAGTPIDRRLQKFFAIVLVAVICLWQGYSRLNYILFSDLFAMYKLVFLTIITVMGWLALAGIKATNPGQMDHPYGVSNLRNDISTGTYSAYGIAIALLQIFRVYSGYENVNYVLEEVQRPPKDPNRVYRRGMKFSILVVTFLYLMVNLAFFATATTKEIIASGDTLQLLFDKMFGPSPRNRVVSNVLLCLSSTGNVMSWTYTNVRVKQEIARMGILPASEFWARSTRYHTPGQSLFLHWVFSTIFIAAAPLDDPNGYLVISTLFHYCRTFIGVILGGALLLAPWLTPFRVDFNTRWHPRGYRRIGGWFLYILTTIFVLSNLFVLILAWFPASLQSSITLKSRVLSNYIGPVTCVSVYGFAFLYWLWDVVILPASGYTYRVYDSEWWEDGDKLDITINYKRQVKPHSPAKVGVDIFLASTNFGKNLWQWWFRNRYLESADDDD